MEAYIKAISYYLPEKVVTNEQLVEEFPEWSVDKIAKKVGISERHIAAEDETAGDNTAHHITIDSVHRCPSPDAVVSQFLEFFLGRHPPLVWFVTFP